MLNFSNYLLMSVLTIVLYVFGGVFVTTLPEYLGINVSPVIDILLWHPTWDNQHTKFDSDF